MEIIVVIKHNMIVWRAGYAPWRSCYVQTYTYLIGEHLAHLSTLAVVNVQSRMYGFWANCRQPIVMRTILMNNVGLWVEEPKTQVLTAENKLSVISVRTAFVKLLQNKNSWLRRRSMGLRMDIHAPTLRYVKNDVYGDSWRVVWCISFGVGPARTSPSALHTLTEML